MSGGSSLNDTDFSKETDLSRKYIEMFMLDNDFDRSTRLRIIATCRIFRKFQKVKAKEEYESGSGEF
jgi:hypothetical protein